MEEGAIQIYQNVVYKKKNNKWEERHFQWDGKIMIFLKKDCYFPLKHDSDLSHAIGVANITEIKIDPYNREESKIRFIVDIFVDKMKYIYGIQSIDDIKFWESLKQSVDGKYPNNSNIESITRGHAKLEENRPTHKSRMATTPSKSSKRSSDNSREDCQSYFQAVVTPTNVSTCLEEGENRNKRVSFNNSVQEKIFGNTPLRPDSEESQAPLIPFQGIVYRKKNSKWDKRNFEYDGKAIAFLKKDCTFPIQDGSELSHVIGVSGITSMKIDVYNREESKIKYIVEIITNGAKYSYGVMSEREYVFWNNLSQSSPNNVSVNKDSNNINVDPQCNNNYEIMNDHPALDCNDEGDNASECSSIVVDDYNRKNCRTVSTPSKKNIFSTSDKIEQKHGFIESDINQCKNMGQLRNITNNPFQSSKRGKGTNSFELENELNLKSNIPVITTAAQGTTKESNDNILLEDPKITVEIVNNNPLVTETIPLNLFEEANGNKKDDSSKSKEVKTIKESDIIEEPSLEMSSSDVDPIISLSQSPLKSANPKGVNDRQSHKQVMTIVVSVLVVLVLSIAWSFFGQLSMVSSSSPSASIQQLYYQENLRPFVADRVDKFESEYNSIAFGKRDYEARSGHYDPSFGKSSPSSSSTTNRRNYANTRHSSISNEFDDEIDLSTRRSDGYYPVDRATYDRFQNERGFSVMKIKNPFIRNIVNILFFPIKSLIFVFRAIKNGI